MGSQTKTPRLKHFFDLGLTPSGGKRSWGKLDHECEFTALKKRSVKVFHIRSLMAEACLKAGREPSKSGYRTAQRGTPRRETREYHGLRTGSRNNGAAFI